MVVILPDIHQILKLLVWIKFFFLIIMKKLYYLIQIVTHMVLTYS